MVYPATEDRPGTDIVEYAEKVPAGGSIVVQASGLSLSGDEVSTYLSLPLPAAESPEARLAGAGLELSASGGKMVVDYVGFGSPAEDAGVSFGWTIDSVQVQNERPPKELVFIPALILLGVVAYGQLRRRTPEEASVTG
jgi:hypothetical protein